MSNFKLKPLGYYVLVEVTEAEQVTQGGIVLPSDLVEKEQSAVETGVVLAFGPTCYIGMRGCEGTDTPAYQQWGVKVGDKVEFKRYEGKNTCLPGHENLRYIPDTHIMGVINE